MNTRQNDLGMSLILTMGGASTGSKIGGHLGEYLDAQALAQAGRVGSHHYWDFRLALAGLVFGIIAGAVAGYMVALFRKNKVR